MRTLLILNGPNLARLGSRKPEIYGRVTLTEIVDQVQAVATELGWQVDAFQSNHEGKLIDHLDARRHVDALVLNPGALMMAGWSLRDALEDFPAPWIEVHLSNIWSRESFRHASILSPLAAGVVAGLGSEGYRLAAKALMQRVDACPDPRCDILPSDGAPA